MKQTLEIYDSKSKGKIVITKERKKSKIFKVEVSLDNYGFEVHIDKKELKELIK